MLNPASRNGNASLTDETSPFHQLPTRKAAPTDGLSSEREEKLKQSLECVRKLIMRYQSSVMIGNVPVISVAFGPDAQSNQNRGRAVGLLALGDVAVGIIAVGAVAAGVIAVGGLAFGVISVGGLALGLVALGGLAVGGVAVGGLAAGFRSLGGLAIGPHPDGGWRVYWPTS
jgi:hypothetical protein